MKLKLVSAAIALALGVQPALAGGPFTDYARVTDVTPEYERVNLPRKECFSEYVPERAPRRGDSLMGPLIGGVAGGLLGAQVGKGNGRIASSAAGAAVGAIVGDRLSQRGGDEYYEREVRRCRMVDHWESHITGYRVAYEYQGRAHSAILPYDPGPRLAVNVSVTPAAGNDRDGRWER
jgi:uncharacterized protein YcfJ